MATLRDLLRTDRPPSESVLRDAQTLRRAAEPVWLEEPESLDPLIEAMAERRFVLLGEATHGTQEFYEFRAAISRRLIERHGFAGIVAEADWPDAGRVNRYLRGHGEDRTAREALGSFERFPLWMWRNTVILDLVETLRNHNDALPRGARRAGFWGMDLYSLYGSIAAVLEYLRRVDPQAAELARKRYGCFDPFNGDPQAYGAAVASGRGFDHHTDCEDEVIAQLLELHRRRGDYARRLAGEPGGEEEHFFAEQNARLVTQAERYYRAMYHGGASTWNLRDTHMSDTLDALQKHLAGARGEPPGLIVWAHNSHLGDARHTEMGSDRGEVNVGQLMRERHGEQVFSLGFTTHTGTVAAADDWDEPPRRMAVQPSRADSIEHLLHLASLSDPTDPQSERDRPASLLMPPARSAAARVLEEPRLERAIGVIYRPATERWSHYFRCAPGRQFDAILHVEETRALKPLDPFEGFEPGHAEAPETYPTGM